MIVLLLFAGLCIAALAIWAYGAKQGTAAQTAIITYQGEVIEEIDLSAVTETRSFRVGPEGAGNTIQVSPEGVGVIQADCPDQICVEQGIRSHGPEPIVCLPHRLTIRFTNGTGENAAGENNADGLDAVTGR